MCFLNINSNACFFASKNIFSLKPYISSEDPFKIVYQKKFGISFFHFFVISPTVQCSNFPDQIVKQCFITNLDQFEVLSFYYIVGDTSAYNVEERRYKKQHCITKNV